MLSPDWPPGRRGQVQGLKEDDEDDEAEDEAEDETTSSRNKQMRRERS